MKKLCLALALAGVFVTSKSSAISLDDIQIWTGSGTNRAAFVIEWSVPQSLTNSTVPAPIADKTMAWGYKFNGSATGLQMLNAIMLADPKLYAVEAFGGGFIEAFGYNLNGDGVIGITDGTATNYFVSGILGSPTVDIDSAHALNPNDLYWGGLFGANWESWYEPNNAGGLLFSPNRGTNTYWTPDDTNSPFSGFHGQWEYNAFFGLDQIPLTNGSWVGYSVAAGEFESDVTAAYNVHKHAPPSPDGTYVAYVCNTNDFAVQIVSTNNVFNNSPYNDPIAMLGRPTLNFLDGLGDHTIHRTKLVEAPYWTSNGSNVITEISSNGQITVNMGRRIYDDPNNPYGVDLIIYGNSFFSISGIHGFVSDKTDLDIGKLSSGIAGHPAIISVSQDNTNWYTYPVVSSLFPDDSYRWDETNHSWTDEVMNPNKPLNPFIYTNNFGGQTVAYGLDQFVGASGGTGYDLKASGLPWIQYVRVQPGVNTYTVIDSIAAVNPVVVGDALSIVPDNIASGLTNLSFQKPSDLTRALVLLSFASVSDITRVSTVSLNEFSSYAPVPGSVSSAYQIALKPVTGTNAVTASANVTLRTSDAYSGNGADLRVYQWLGTNWASQPFNYHSNQVQLAGVTSFSAFVVSQIVPPQLASLSVTNANGFTFQFVPVPNCLHTVERSSDFISWTNVAVITPTNSMTVSFQDTNAPTESAFYRLQVTVP